MPHPGHPGPLPDPTPTHQAGANPEHQKLHIDTIMVPAALLHPMLCPAPATRVPCRTPPTQPAPTQSIKNCISTPLWSAGGSSASNVMRLQLIKYAGGGPLNMIRRVPRPCPPRPPGPLAHPAGANPEHQKLHIDTIMVRGRLFCIQCNAATTNQICGRRSAEYDSPGAQAMPHPGHGSPHSPTQPAPTQSIKNCISTPLWSAGGSSASNAMPHPATGSPAGPHPAGANPEHQKLHIDTIMVRGRLFCIQCYAPPRPPGSPAGPTPPTKPAPIQSIKNCISTPLWSVGGSSASNVMRLQLIKYAGGGPLNMLCRVPRLCPTRHRVPCRTHPTHQAGANPEHQKLHIDTIMVRGRLFCIQCNAATTNQICGRRSAEYALSGAQAMPRPPGSLPDPTPPTKPAPIQSIKNCISTPLWSAGGSSASNVMRLQLIKYAGG
eukprot:gene12842-8736_t